MGGCIEERRMNERMIGKMMESSEYKNKKTKKLLKINILV